jgi:hypothetical protein
MPRPTPYDDALHRLTEGLGPVGLAQGRATFAWLLAERRRALRHTSALLDDLCDAGADVEDIANATRMARAVGQHVSVCARALKQLGGEAGEVYLPPPGSAHTGWPAPARVVRSMIELLCIDTTLTVGVLSSMRRAARNAAARELFGSMLDDVRSHAAFGWGWLRRHGRHMPLGLRDWVMDWLPDLLADVEARSRPALEAVTRTSQAPPCPCGGLSPAEQEVAFLRAMHERILPGLRRAGLDGTTAWSIRPEREGSQAA